MALRPNRMKGHCVFGDELFTVHYLLENTPMPLLDLPDNLGETGEIRRLTTGGTTVLGNLPR